VLVVDINDQVVGRLVVWDVLQGLEHRGRHGIDVLSMVDGLGGWRQPLTNLAAKAHHVRVKDIVRSLNREERIAADAPLNEAVHRLISLRALSLIVTSDSRSVGVLRVVDVFNQVLAEVKACMGSDPYPG